MNKPVFLLSLCYYSYLLHVTELYHLYWINEDTWLFPLR